MKKTVLIILLLGLLVVFLPYDYKQKILHEVLSYDFYETDDMRPSNLGVEEKEHAYSLSPFFYVPSEFMSVSMSSGKKRSMDMYFSCMENFYKSKDVISLSKKLLSTEMTLPDHEYLDVYLAEKFPGYGGMELEGYEGRKYLVGGKDKNGHFPGMRQMLLLNSVYGHINSTSKLRLSKKDKKKLSKYLKNDEFFTELNSDEFVMSDSAIEEILNEIDGGGNGYKAFSKEFMRIYKDADFSGAHHFGAKSVLMIPFENNDLELLDFFYDRGMVFYSPLYGWDLGNNLIDAYSGKLNAESKRAIDWLAEKNIPTSGKYLNYYRDSPLVEYATKAQRLSHVSYQDIPEEVINRYDEKLTPYYLQAGVQNAISLRNECYQVSSDYSKGKVDLSRNTLKKFNAWLQEKRSAGSSERKVDASLLAKSRKLLPFKYPKQGHPDRDKLLAFRPLIDAIGKYKSYGSFGDAIYESVAQGDVELYEVGDPQFLPFLLDDSIRRIDSSIIEALVKLDIDVTDIEKAFLLAFSQYKFSQKSRIDYFKKVLNLGLDFSKYGASYQMLMLSLAELQDYDSVIYLAEASEGLGVNDDSLNILDYALLTYRPSDSLLLESLLKTKVPVDDYHREILSWLQKNNNDDFLKGLDLGIKAVNAQSKHI
ncbi:hypothetical protein QSV34_03135 [Porticoccus sp. W117]|uniref:hypothetical protein n=1 Tax=Porticoccus sp. W117 TaxID=3054777 RepID=UPI00259664DD|nr:hypothetical protein [Porticoccus sp. W117]MDM3870343.1 hypothetical protein [Porticoccus sp. W117]